MYYNSCMSARQVVVCTGGGTAGHVNPALEIAGRLRERYSAIAVVWMGSKRGVERQIIAATDIPFYAVPCGKLRRYFSLRNVSDAMRTLVGILVALLKLARLSVDSGLFQGGICHRAGGGCGVAAAHTGYQP